MATNNPYLRLISGGQTVTISACKGGARANIYNAKKIFSGYIDNNFENYGCNTPQPATEETEVLVYEMYNEDANFRTLFGSLGSDLKSLAFESQEQIVTFCKENKQWLRTDGLQTYFLFTEKVKDKEKFFVARVYFHAGKLEVSESYLLSGIWRSASNAHRIVVPATKTLKLQS